MWRAVFRYFAVTLALSWSVGATNITVVGVSTGIDPKTLQRPARRNINDLYAEGGPEWDLYILALSSFQAVNESDDQSYFQIAGIHGLPYSAWNNVQQVEGAPNIGYCPHGELLFATWHRPYLALFEQILVSHAVNISVQYSPNVSPTYQSAAQTLRIPYWDWASDPRVPGIVANVTVTVNGPTGRATIPNPLYRYRFQSGSIEAGFPGSFAKHDETIRCVEDGGLNDNVTASNLNMESARAGLRRSIYSTFIMSTTFDAMAYSHPHAWNFEDPHNLVHRKACCGGTLSEVNWSAFDPLFMLHHCNIDRLVAMWQAIYPDSSMFNTTGVSLGQFATPRGTQITQDSPLKPFRNGPLSFHTSDSVTNISTFGYTYPEIKDWAATPDQLANSVRTAVNNLYDPDNSLVDTSTRRPNKQIHADAPSSSPTNKYYAAEIQLDRSEFALPATVYLLVNGTTVGTMAILSMPSEGVASASVPLLDLTRAGLPTQNMDSRTTGSFLQQGLTVAIRGNDDSMVPVDNVPSLKVEIKMIDYTPSSHISEFPRLGGATRLPIVIRQHWGY